MIISDIKKIEKHASIALECAGNIGCSLTGWSWKIFISRTAKPKTTTAVIDIARLMPR
jgi:hypothetical protein